MIHLFRFFTLLVPLLVLTASCQQHQDKPLPRLRIGHAPHDHHAPLYVAAMNPDYFKEHGGIYLEQINFRKEYRLIANQKYLADILIETSAGGKELIRKLNEDHFDLSFGGFPAMLSYIDQGSPIKILSPVMADGAGLVLKKELPPDNWNEFLLYVRNSTEPLKIGYKNAVSVQNLIFERALKESGISYSKNSKDTNAQIILLNLYGPKNLIPALENSLIDGFVTMQPFLALVEERGSGKTIADLKNLPPEGKWPGTPCCALAANNKYVNNHTEIVLNLVTLLQHANQYIRDNPQQSAVDISQWLGITPEVEKKSIATIKYTNNLDSEWQQGVTFWVENMIESGRLNNEVKKAYESGSLEELIYNTKLYELALKRL
ncbi:MAG: ABC transporter substrate-binding protein [Desulfobulbaceae bacterium]|nr:ABC transporter substrate-binding protein [Desulfobulbaceae bacterium]